jgi:hypothetical protein
MGDQTDNMNSTLNLQGLLEAMNASHTATTESNTHTITALGDALNSFLQRQGTSQVPKGGGPKPREPKTYDGERSNGQLEDHIRDLQNWVVFHERRHQWSDEAEKIQQASTYLTGKMHRMFTVQQHSIHTFMDYIDWLQVTFKDVNEQSRLKDKWQECVQGQRSAMDYASDLIYLAARIQPQKTAEEIREHFRTGLQTRIQINMAEHPEWDNLSLNDYIARADRQDQIELAKEQVRKRMGTTSHSQSFAIAGSPRRGGRIPGVLTRRPRKGTEEWRTYCRQNEACFNCGEKGHNARDCSQPTDTPGQQQQSTPARQRPGSIPPKKRWPGRQGKART